MPFFKKNPRCPYCGNELEKKPTRRKKCPHCSEYIYVRGGELLTEKQTKERDLLKRWLSPLERYGASEKMFEEERKRLSSQFGFEAPVSDTLWRLMNALIPKQKDCLDLERLYLLMADFVREEGKEPEPYVRQAMEIKEAAIKQEVLRLERELGELFTVRVSVSTCNDEHVCRACREASEHTYEISEFLENMPIPRDCENPRGCRCWVNAKFD
jgi:hypothetical protein